MAGNPSENIAEKRILTSILIIPQVKGLAGPLTWPNSMALKHDVLNEQVRRNKEKFPPDFMFQLTDEEFVNLKSQFATSSSGWGGRRKLPYIVQGLKQ